jgi:hypothetical protein
VIMQHGRSTTLDDSSAAPPPLPCRKRGLGSSTSTARHRLSGHLANPSSTRVATRLRSLCGPARAACTCISTRRQGRAKGLFYL